MMWALVLLGACDPYAAWPEARTGFPWDYTPVEGLEAYEEVRFETETWTPFEDVGPTALYALKALQHRAGAPIEEILHFGSSRPTPLVAGHPVLTFAGDVMRMDGAAPAYANAVVPLLDGALRVANLETPVSQDHPLEREALTAAHGPLAFNAPRSMLQGLPFDVLQLNNNHSLDLGLDGFVNTHHNVVDAGLVSLGFDGNRSIHDLGDGVVVALLAYTWGSNTPVGDVDLGVVPFGRLDEPVDLGRVGAEIGNARSDGATHVVLMLHWGFEYEYWPDPHFMGLARDMVAAGGDVVVGHGPHTPQPAELCAVDRPSAIPGVGRCSVRSGDDRPRTAAVLYSLGNFGTEQPTLPLQVGVVGSVSLDPFGGVSGLGWEGVARSPSSDGWTVRPLDDRVADEGSKGDYADERQRVTQLLGTSWMRAR